MKPRGESKLLLIMALVVLLGGGAMFGLTALQNAPEPPTGQPTPAPKLSDATFDTMIKNARNVHGPADAKVTVVEFADFQCPSCRRAYNGNDGKGGPIQELKKKPVRFIFRHLPLVNIHDRAMPASVAAEAAGRQGKFWPMYDALFTGNKTELTQEFFDTCARKIGLDMDKFHKDQADPALIEIAKADTQIATETGIDSTPTFVVRGPDGKLSSVTGGNALKDLMAGMKL